MTYSLGDVFQNSPAKPFFVFDSLQSIFINMSQLLQEKITILVVLLCPNCAVLVLNSPVVAELGLSLFLDPNRTHMDTFG